MKVSVVIPAYNEEKTLPFLLKSLRSQNFPKEEYEVIVVDNNSTDKTAKIAEKLGAKVLPEERQGIPYARDKGVRVAKGEIIVGTNADCVFPSDYLQKIYNKFQRNKELFGLCGSIKMNDAPLPVKFIAEILFSYAHYYSLIFKKTSLCGALNFSFRRDKFLEVNGYDLELPLLKKGVDSDGS